MDHQYTFTFILSTEPDQYINTIRRIAEHIEWLGAKDVAVIPAPISASLYKGIVEKVPA